MSGALLAALVATAFVLLGRWGLANAPQLAAGGSAERRAKEERSMRRGARSCLVIGALFAVLSAVLAVGTVTGTG